MAVEKEFDIKVNTADAVAEINKLAGAVDGVKDATKEAEVAAKKLAAAEKEAAQEAKEAAQANKEEQEDLLGAVDEVTGGYVRQFRELGKGLAALPGQFGKFKTSAVTAFRSAVTGANAMKTALIATGIGAIVVALGLIAAYWDNIVGAISGASVEQKKFLENAEKNVTAQEDAYNALSLSENSLRLQGKTEKQIRDLKIQQTEETIKALEAQLVAQEGIKKSQVDASKRNKEILQGIIRFLTLPLTTLLGVIDMVGQALGKDFGLEESFSGGLASLVFDPEEVAEEADKTIDETTKKLAELKSRRDGFLLADKNEKEAQAAKDADKKKQDDDKAEKDAADAEARKNAAIAAQKEADAQKAADMGKELDEKVFNQQLTEQEREKNAVRDKFFALQEFYKDNAEVLAQITEQERKELQEINDKYDKEELDKKKGQRQEIINLVVESANSLISNLKELNSLYDQDDEEAAKRAFQRNKALQLAQAIINTASGIMSAYANPLDVASGAAFAKAATIAVTGATQIAVISAQQYKGNASQSSGGGQAPTAPSATPPQSTAPSFNIVGQSGTNQLQDAITNALGQPMRAYVVGSDITSQQELDRKKVSTATIG